MLFGIDLPAEATAKLLGFAIKRTDSETGKSGYLPNFLRLKSNAEKPHPFPSDANPIQAFVWGDYTPAPGAKLRYGVEARYTGDAGPEVRHAVELDVRLEDEDDGNHGIYFNRGAAGSQAYAERFKNEDPRGHPDAQKWLSRGLEEALLDHIAAATGPKFALHGAFYEFHQEQVLSAFADAVERGADVQLVVARPKDPKSGKEIYPATANVEAVKAAKLDAHVRWRTHSVAIPHNKFMILLEDDKPQTVWTGSTNITDGALWGQSNLAHCVHETKLVSVAPAYIAYWEQLTSDPETSALRAFNQASNPVPVGLPPDHSVSEIFSPHQGDGALKWLAERIEKASGSVFFTAPFGITGTFEKALLTQHSFPIYALLDKDDNDMTLLRGNPENEIASGAYLGKGPWHQFLQEALTGLNKSVRYIHTKYLLIDPLSDDPLVVSGSANFSPASVADNDENMLVIRGDTRVADIYLTEFMRLFTHMYFRQHVATAAATAGKGAVPMAQQLAPTSGAPLVPAGASTDESEIFLKDDDSWTGSWFAPGEDKTRERELFA